MSDRIIIKPPEGHVYSIFNLGGEGEQIIQFRQDRPFHEPKPGILIQDLIRICIHRLKVLDHEKPWPLNKITINLLRQVLAYQEARALVRHVEKGKIAHIEFMEIDPRDGHLNFEKL